MSGARHRHDSRRTRSARATGRRGHLQFIQRPACAWPAGRARRPVRQPVLGLPQPAPAVRGAPVKRQPGGPLQERGRRCETTRRCARPAGLLEFGSNFSSGPARPGHGAKARRSGSAAGSVTSASARAAPASSGPMPTGRRRAHRGCRTAPRADSASPAPPPAPRPAPDREPPGRPPHQHGSPDDRPPPAAKAAGLRWQPLQLPPEALLDPRSSGTAPAPRTAVSCARRHPRALQQRQRFPSCRDDPVPDPRVQRPGQPRQHRLQQLPRIASAGPPLRALAARPRPRPGTGAANPGPPGSAASRRARTPRLRRAWSATAGHPHAHQRTFPAVSDSKPSTPGPPEPSGWAGAEANAVRSASPLRHGRDSA